MNPDPRRTAHVYVVTLAPNAGEPAATPPLRGRVEHVSSGRRHDFDNGPALLACLAHEEQQVAQAVQAAQAEARTAELPR